MLSKEDIKSIVSSGEAYNAEFKVRVPSKVKELAEEVCAFANAAGGVVLLGVDDQNIIQVIQIDNRKRSGIQNEIKLANLPEPVFKTDGLFTVVFQRIPKRLSNENLEKTTQKTYENIIKEKWSEKWSDFLTDRQKEILILIIENPKITRLELSSKLKINQSAIQKHIETLKTKDILKRIGPDKGRHWEIIDII
ncbi:MAG: putative DNA binding domain-containing protein [Bacteroidales bacterium]|nr:putative DNA binding domain-containing protein [Bacteroidales bacterium]